MSNLCWQYEFDYKGHLGNTRVSFKANGNNLEKNAETAFDPFGVRLPIGVNNTFQNRFEMQSKESEKTFGLNRINLGARTVNPTIGRFDRVDAMADKWNIVSPYTNVLNNPLRIIDPDGNDLILLFYASGQKGSDEFQKAAETRRREIEGGKDFNSKTDKVLVIGYDKVEQIKDFTNNAISEFGKDFGKTSEVGIWSHASSVDGPIGRLPNDNYPAGEGGIAFKCLMKVGLKLTSILKKKVLKLIFMDVILVLLVMKIHLVSEYLLC